MQSRLFILTCLLIFGVALHAHINPDLHNQKRPGNQKEGVTSLRMDCAQATQQIDLAVNNVRARLLNGGDMWWDLDGNGRYIVPKVEPGSGLEEVSSIFAGSVWLGGFDPGGSLKLACQDFRGSNSNEFWPGPLTENEGLVDAETCANWDRFWTINANDIDEHLRNYQIAQANNVPYEAEDVPESLWEWPGKGNVRFFELNGFDLPFTDSGLGSFFDRNENGIYEPTEGEYPDLEIRGCQRGIYADEMIFWIYNDNGGIHTNTDGSPIRMEVQVQAFGFATADEINDMTFYRYKLINRAPEQIDQFYFAMWVDPDLGCSSDDYVGCDTSRSLAYTYNMDAADGDPGTECSASGPVPTYGFNIPYLGVDYFRGPLGPKVINDDGTYSNPGLNEPFDTTVELGMDAFTYYNRGGQGGFTGPAAQTDPDQPAEFYNYLTGSWRDGTPFTLGGSGFNVGGTNAIDFAFPDTPDDPNGWSMCTANLGQGDRRTIQASGPMRLDPGSKNELIVGAVWVPNGTYPCPNIDRLLAADDVAQNLFDLCFKIPNGPDAPEVDWLELDREIVGILTNEPNISNNAGEAFTEPDVRATVEAGSDTLFEFQGYIVYQLIDESVGVSELSDISRARPIFQSDVKDDVANLYNWKKIETPATTADIFEPELKVQSVNEGIRHTFQITEDQFSTDDRKLINHKKYYYLALAYAHNNWKDFNPLDGSGQVKPFFQGRKGSSGEIKTYTVIPRPMNDQILNAGYGDGAQITRIDGVGAGEQFLDMTEETLNGILDGSFNGEITYKEGRGPFEVQIFNPLGVVDGDYVLTLDDNSLGDLMLGDTVHWVLTNETTGEELRSDRPLSEFNEQLLACFGISIRMGQSDDAGDAADDENGAIGVETTYADAGGDQWFTAQTDQDAAALFNSGVLNFVKTDEFEQDNDEDPNQAFTTRMGNGFWLPYTLCDFNIFPPNDPSQIPYLSPGWLNTRASTANGQNKLETLNNVDIIFTSDTSKWSRCVVVETASEYYTDINYGIGLPTDGNRDIMILKAKPSVGKEDADNDGLPDPDGDGEGMSWFPGYAVDVETGKRLNIFFGENSIYARVARLDSTFFNALGEVGNDMMYNPTSQYIVNLPVQNVAQLFSTFYMGGQHFIYVTDTEYDECALYRDKLSADISNDALRIPAIRTVKWTSMSYLQPGSQFLSYGEGLIPNDLTVKLRVDNPYEVASGTDEYNGYPSYRFSIDGKSPKTDLTTAEQNELLDLVNVVPNPYYGFSSYETSQFTTTVKLTNLPARCVVTIYSLDGKFIRQYNRDERREDQTIDRQNSGIKLDQVTPDLEWDLKNNKGIPIGSGVYLVHIDAFELGERTLKWFGVNRQFDPSGL